MLQFSCVKKVTRRVYKSLVRQRQASDTRSRIAEAARQLLQSDGYAGMTMEAIANKAEVSVQSVYSVFKSKAGILSALLDQAAFGTEFEDTVHEAMNTAQPEP